MDEAGAVGRTRALPLRLTPPGDGRRRDSEARATTCACRLPDPREALSVLAAATHDLGHAALHPPLRWLGESLPETPSRTHGHRQCTMHSQATICPASTPCLPFRSQRVPDLETKHGHLATGLHPVFSSSHSHPVRQEPRPVAAGAVLCGSDAVQVSSVIIVISLSTLAWITLH